MADNTKKTYDMLLLSLIWITSSSWLLFQTPYTTMTVLLPILGSGTLILFYWVFSRLLMYSGLLSRRRAILAVCLVCIFLALLLPLTSWYSDTQNLNKMFAALGVQATQTGVKIYLLDSVGDVAEHERGVIATYQLTMPIEEAKTEIFRVLKPLPGWDVYVHPLNEGLVVDAGCGGRGNGWPEVAVRLRTDGTLTLWIPRFLRDNDCYLK
ncbi:MAG: hypothetical protein WAU10_05385 [Caldilineaceae bacterium]